MVTRSMSVAVSMVNGVGISTAPVRGVNLARRDR